MENPKMEFERLSGEEKCLYFDSFSREDAYRLGTLIINKAQDRPGALAVEIVLNGMMVFRFYPTGITRDHEFWLQRKRNSVELRGISSLSLKAMAEMNHNTLEDWKLNPSDYSLGGGGYPINIKNTGMIGSICVSGYPDTEDHQIIVDSMKELIYSMQNK